MNKVFHILLIIIDMSLAIPFSSFSLPALSNSCSNSTRPTHHVGHQRKAQYLAFYNKHTAWAAAKHLHQSVKLHCSCSCCCCCCVQILQRLLQHRIAAAQRSSAASKIKFRLQTLRIRNSCCCGGIRAAIRAICPHNLQLCLCCCCCCWGTVEAAYCFHVGAWAGAGAWLSLAHRYIRFH